MKRNTEFNTIINKLEKIRIVSIVGKYVEYDNSCEKIIGDINHFLLMLPRQDFIKIDNNFILNLNKVSKLIGNQFYIDNKSYLIGSRFRIIKQYFNYIGKVGFFNIPHFNNHLFLKKEDGYIVCRCSDILCFEAFGSYTKIIFNNKKKHILSMNLSTTYTFVNNSKFIRINRSYVVNMFFIEKFNRTYVWILGKLNPIALTRSNKDYIINTIKSNLLFIT